LSSDGQNSKPDLYVIARIIEALKLKKKLNKTTLATSTGLSYDRLVKYLSWMLDRDFIRIDEDGLVSLTEVGSKVYDDLVGWIMKYVGKLRFSRLGRPRT
jgi:predicted transcriptional regulator